MRLDASAIFFLSTPTQPLPEALTLHVWTALAPRVGFLEAPPESQVIGPAQPGRA